MTKARTKNNHRSISLPFPATLAYPSQTGYQISSSCRELVELASQVRDQPLSISSKKPQSNHNEDELRQDIAHSSHSNLNINYGDKYLQVRNLCAMGLLLGWIGSMASIAIGTYIICVTQTPMPSFLSGKAVRIGTKVYNMPSYMHSYLSGHRAYAVSTWARLFITFLLNLAVTVLLDCMGYIQATTLRWALAREGRLRTNSNLRFISCIKSFFPHAWYMNFTSLLSLGIVYGATSSLSTNIDVIGGWATDQGGGIVTIAPAPDQLDGLDINGWGVLALGLGLFLQAFVCTCCLCKSSIVGTWSSHPLKNAQVYAYRNGTLGHGQCTTDDMTPIMMYSEIADGEFSDFTLYRPCHSYPKRRQPCLKYSMPRVCRIRYVIWGYFVIFAAWSVIIGCLSMFNSSTDMQDPGGGSDRYWKYYGDIIGLLQSKYQVDWLGVVIQIAAQTFVTIGLQCMEIFTNMSRDEALWRKASTRDGIDIGANPVKVFVTSWQSILLLICKAVTQWVFGYAFCADIAVAMALIPMTVMAGLFLLSAIFTEYLVRNRPQGHQPVCYGDLTRLSHFVDDWRHPKLFWGDKGQINASGIRRAGTAGHPLPQLRSNAPYIGLKPQI